MSAKNRSLIRHYVEVKNIGSLKARKVIERVNSHRLLPSEARGKSSYRISHPIDIGTYPLRLDFHPPTPIYDENRTVFPSFEEQNPKPVPQRHDMDIDSNNNNNDIDIDIEDIPIPDPLFFDGGEVIEIGVARTGRVMKAQARLCRLPRRTHTVRARPGTIVDGELQVVCAAGRTAGRKRTRIGGDDAAGAGSAAGTVSLLGSLRRKGLKALGSPDLGGGETGWV